MPVKIRLARRGRTKKPFYHIVIADSRAKRDGKFIEQIGSYNPMTSPATIELDREKAYEWLLKGAQPTYTAQAILRFKGVMFRKHLMRGVSKGSFDMDTAMKMYQDFIDAKDEKIRNRMEATLEKKMNYWKEVAGTVKPVKKAEAAPMAEAFREENDEPTVDVTVDDAVETVEEVVAEAVETAEEVVAEEAASTDAPAEEA
jgi:small subunit ribosomal protein S16